jgi:hypothetical protein
MDRYNNNNNNNNDNNNIGSQLNESSNIDHIANNLIQQTENDYTTLKKDNTNSIFKSIKEPLLVVLLSILISIPIINNALLLTLGKISNNISPLIPITIKSLFIGLLFFLIRKFI